VNCLILSMRVGKSVLCEGWLGVRAREVENEISTESGEKECSYLHSNRFVLFSMRLDKTQTNKME
jgi:hypothetical protein